MAPVLNIVGSLIGLCCKWRFQNRGNGQFQLTVSAGFDGRGERKRYYKTITAAGKTESAQLKDAQLQLSLFISEIKRGECADMGNSKLSDFAAYWMTEHVENSLAPKTIVSYRGHLDDRIVPALGNIRLKNLKPLHIVKFLNELDSMTHKINPAYKKLEATERNLQGARYETRLLSGKTKQNIHRTMSSMLKDAVQWGLIPFNPCERAATPKVKKRKIAFLNEADVPKLLAAIDTEPLKWKVAIYIALFGGLRRGEIAALEWRDIDFEKNTIRVERNSQYIAGLGVITKTPKTESSIREIAMHKAVMELLRLHNVEELKKRVKLGNKWEGAGKPELYRILTGWNGKPIFPDSLSQWFDKLISRIDLSTPITFHGLRHSSATLLLAKGISIKNISERLGHADANVTLAVYSHALQSVDRLAADALGDMIPEQKQSAAEV